MAASPSPSLERILWFQPWTDKLFSFRLTRPLTFRFTPGQFVRLGLAGDEGQPLWRPYSMVSAPYDDYLEFYSIAVPDGPFTSRLRRLRVGDSLAVDHTAWGFLTTSRFQGGDSLWLLATGTGLAPFLSILTDPAVWESYSRIILVHSVREAAELTYQDWLAALPAHPLVGPFAHRLVYQPVVTRSPHPGALQARIPTLLQNGRLEQALQEPLTTARSRLMICGNPAMVSDTLQVLQARGFQLAKRDQAGQIAVENSF